MEQAAVVDHFEDGSGHQGNALFLDQAAPDLHAQSGNAYLARTDVLAGAALNTQALDIFGAFQLIIPGRKNGADAARVDRAEDVSAHKAENRADIQAGGASVFFLYYPGIVTERRQCGSTLISQKNMLLCVDLQSGV